MPYRLRMSAELGDWLTELRASEPAVAAEVAATLVAVLDAATMPGPPLVTDLSAAPVIEPGELRAAADFAYQDLLASLQLVRHQVAVAASWQTATRHRITKSGSEPLPWTAEEIAQERRREEELTRRAQRCQADADTFRAKKEAAKASYAAARARREIQLTILATLTQPATEDDRRERAEAEAELAAAELALTAATAALRDLLASAATIRRTFITDPAGQNSGGSGAASPEPGLLELRAAPLTAELRLLFAVEPAGTVSLLAALEGAAAIAQHRSQAIDLAGQLLTEIRDGGWPAEDAGQAASAELTFADSTTFLARFFPGQRSAITARAAVLAAATTLAELRRRRGLALADLARATDLSEEELWRLESGELTAVRLGDIAACVRALGGRLDLTATFDDTGPVTL